MGTPLVTICAGGDPDARWQERVDRPATGSISSRCSPQVTRTVSVALTTVVAGLSKCGGTIGSPDSTSAGWPSTRNGPAQASSRSGLARGVTRTPLVCHPPVESGEGRNEFGEPSELTVWACTATSSGAPRGIQLCQASSPVVWGRTHRVRRLRRARWPCGRRAIRRTSATRRTGRRGTRGGPARRARHHGGGR